MLGDLTRTDALTAAPETTVAEAAAAMRTRDADVVVVVDENRPLGLLTPETIGRAVVADEDVREMAAGEVVADDPVTVSEAADREAVVRLFSRRDARAAIVVDEAEEYVGVVTFDDLLAAYAREFDALLELAE